MLYRRGNKRRHNFNYFIAHFVVVEKFPLVEDGENSLNTPVIKFIYE
jgi:hypothetical protein